MNLGEHIAKILLEQDKTTIGIFPGAFKPPHKGHFDVVKKLLQKVDQVVVLVSPKTRDGVTADESVAVWELYKKYLDGPVEIRVAGVTPVGEAYDVVKNNPDTDFVLAFGKNEIDRFKNMIKNPNATIFDAGEVEGVNATGLRDVLKKNDQDKIIKYIPDGVTVEEFLQAINRKAKPEEDKGEEVNLQEGKLNESETATIGEFIKYACKNLAIQNPPRNLTLSYDTNQVKDRRSFGYFDPNSSKVWVYVKNRNMADILRTLAHELVHHKQNLDGRISYESGKTGSDIENEANAKAGILLRDFGKLNDEIYQ
jgi:cytidyltransferase-like protein